MTILNCIINPERALIAANTENNLGRQSAKLFALPHVNAVFAGRGLVDVILGIHNALAVHGGTFDEMAELVGVFGKTAGRAVTVARLLGRIPKEEAKKARKPEIVLVGYSENAQRIVGWEWNGDFVRESFPHYSIAPDPKARAPQDLPGLLALFPKQRDELLAAKGPVPGAGGEIVFAQVTRDSIAMKKVPFPS